MGEHGGRLAITLYPSVLQVDARLRSEAIDQLRLDPEKRRRFSHAGRQSAAEHHTPEAGAHAVLSLVQAHFYAAGRRSSPDVAVRR